MLKIDVERLIHQKPSTSKIIRLLLSDPGVLAVGLMRLQSWFFHHRMIRLSSITRVINVILTGADFCKGCAIGEGVIIRHPNGIVIGSGVVIGKNCTMLQQITLGEKMGDGSDTSHVYPRIMDDVVINAGAKLIGGITVGEHSVIGANSVVVKDVPPYSIVAGVPAKVIRTCRPETSIKSDTQ